LRKKTRQKKLGGCLPRFSWILLGARKLIQIGAALLYPRRRARMNQCRVIGWVMSESNCDRKSSISSMLGC
jgi:hypothetical protein